MRSGFNLTAAAQAMFTSQPGVSRQILELEDELGITIFERTGKRLTGLTEAGEMIMVIADRLLRDAENLKQVGREFADATSGTLTIATTHNQARHVLPQVVQTFRADFPSIRIALKQGGPETIADWVVSGDADFGIASEALPRHAALVSFPCYQWHHEIVVPKDHPLCAVSSPGLADLAAYPLITYDHGLTGRRLIDEAFQQAGLPADIGLTAMDSDVIQQYVALGLGVGIVATTAVEHGLNPALMALSGVHLFPANTTFIAVRRGAYLRNYKINFLLRMAPAVTREALLAAV